ncbi:hypothetical protein ABZ572_03545 [Streptomyces sp. NPDC018338]
MSDALLSMQRVAARHGAHAVINATLAINAKEGHGRRKYVMFGTAVWYG